MTDFQYYIPTTAYTNYVNTGIFGVYGSHTDAPYHDQISGCALTGGSYTFGVLSNKLGTMSAIWVDGVKYRSNTSQFYPGGDKCHIALELFDLPSGVNEKIFTLSVVGATATAIYGVKVVRTGQEETTTVAETTTAAETTTVAETTTSDQPVINDWIQFGTKPSVYDTVYYVSEAARNTLMTSTAMRDLYTNVTGDMAPWHNNLPAGTPSYSYVCGAGGTAVIIDGVTYTSDNINVSLEGDSVSMAQSLFQLAEGETERVFKVTIVGLTNHTYWLKVKPEEDPGADYDASAITDWTQIPSPKGDVTDFQYYIPTTAYTNYVNTAVFGVYANHTDMPYHNQITNCTLTGGTYSFAAKNIGTMSAIWTEGTKYKINTTSFCPSGDKSHIALELFDLPSGVNEQIFTLSVVGTTATATYGVKVVRTVPETTIEETTTEPTEIVPIQEPEGATWTEIPSDTQTTDQYYYYVPSEYEQYIVNSQFGNKVNSGWVYVGYTIIGAPFKTVKLNNVSIDNSNVAYVNVKHTDMVENGVYRLDVVSANDVPVTVYIKKARAMDYKPTGFAASLNEATANIAWTPSADAVSSGCTYTVTVNETSATVSGSSATFDMTQLEYGKYNVVLTTYNGAKVVDTQTVEINYKEPGTVEGTLTTVKKWEAYRNEVLSWTEIENATGYAVYVDGQLYATTNDLSYTIPAYAFANRTNANSQATTVGSHTTQVVALFEDETAPENTENVNNKHSIGTDDFTLYVNYIYGNGTDRWNSTGVESLWNFTICESADASDITRGANAEINYDTDGSANVTINDVGKHSTYVDMDNPGDQVWTIKSSIYDAEIAVGKLMDLQFDITGPASLVGQRIMIKCCPEEMNADGSYSNDIYEEKLYTFEDDGDGGAVLHYSNTFTSTNDSYDLFFGLGLLQNPDDEDKTPIEINISDATATKVYGITSVTASSVSNTADNTNNGILVNWNSNVPSHLKDEYTYTVTIDGNVVSQDATSGNTYAGYATGQHTVVVKSFYGNSETSSMETTVTIEDTNQPDVVITGISIPNGEYHIGDTVPISITMKNIGTATAAPTGNLTVHLHVNDTEATGTEKGYYTVEGNTLASGESVTNIINYVVSSSDHDGDNLFYITAEADADKNVTESNENNNIYTSVFKFYSALEAVTLTNDGTNVKATWPKDNDDIQKYIVKYTSNGELVQAEVSSELVNPEYAFPAGSMPDNNTNVEVTVLEADGSTYVYARGMAKADLIINSLTPENGIAYVGEAGGILAEVKNIGTARATAEQQLLAVIFTNAGVFQNYATSEQILEPNATTTITVAGYTPTVEGTVTLNATVDDANRFVESNKDNNTSTVNVIAVNKGTLALQNNEGTVTASWDANTSLSVEGYQLTYVSNGVTKTVNIESSETSYTFTEAIDNNTDVIISAKYTDAGSNYYQFATTKALADLIITAVNVPENTYLNESFDMAVTIKNQGTAQVSSTVDDLEHYGEWIIVSMEQNASFSNNTLIQGHSVSGLAAGASDIVTLTGTTGTVLGTYNLNVKVDAPGFEVAQTNGFITESDETNNTFTKSVTIESRPFVQQKMDWEPLVSDAEGHIGETYGFLVGGASQNSHIYYKILDTSITDYNYIDIIPIRVGYNNSYMSMHWVNGYLPINELTASTTDTKISMALVANMNDSTVEAAQYEQIALQNFDYVSPDGDTTKNIPSSGSDSAFIVNGNGFNYYVGNFGLYKYYLMKIEKANGDYTTIAYKVTDENDEMGSWIRANADLGNTANPEKLPFYYHDSSCETTGSFWYDSTDLKLSSISCYNGNYLAMHISDAVTFGTNYKIEAAYASVDTEGNFVVPTTGFEEVPIYNKEGSSTLQLQLPTLLKALPVHSTLAGNVDDEYYYLKVYYDVDNKPNEYVAIPVRIKALIPQIEEVNGLATAARGDTLSVSWTNTTTQNSHGYLYDVYINDVLVSQNVVAGAYNYTGYDLQTIGNSYNIRVEAKWCDQTTDASVAYTVTTKEEETETMPSEEITYPDEQNQQWKLISGEYVLPIKEHNTVSREVNAKIYYYTDVDMDSVVGYNGYYLALNGSTEYFTGSSSKLYVQNANSTSFVAKGIYDNFYSGKILMKASQMFSTYDGWNNGDGTYNTLYYTVKVVGDNGNTAKNFYFKVVPTDEEYVEPTTGEWREISGQSDLPVKIGGTSLEGKVYFYDYQSKTNTYDIVGYNGYYMSVIGKNNYYTGSSTTMEISKALSDTSMETNTSDILNNVGSVDYEFSGKTISDKVWPGQIIIKSEDTFTVAYGTTYYLMKINGVDGNGNTTTTYVPMKIVVDTGNVEIQGFQMNTDRSSGAVAEYNPSFRVVSKSSKVMNINNVLHEVKGYGTVYALDNNVKDNYSQMTVDGSDNVYHFKTTNIGTLGGYTSGNGDEKYNNYYALTFKHDKYNYYSLTEKYAFRAYAQLDDGAIVYGANVYSVDMREIAENLYQNCKTSTKASHDFLYNNILNVITMSENRAGICKSMLRALGVKTTSDPNYTLVNKVNYDIFDYSRCNGEYTYESRDEFTCKSIDESELLDKLNAVTSTSYTKLAEWIYNHTESYGYDGMYKVVPYNWENNIYNGLDAE